MGKTFRLACLGIVFYWASPVLFAQPGVWRVRGPSGWNQGKLTIDSSGALYATTYAGLFQSLDRGGTWRLLYPSPDRQDSLHPNGFAVNPRDERHLNLATDAGLAESSDRGTSWSLKPLPFPPAIGVSIPEGTFPLLAIDPFNENIFYAVEIVAPLTGSSGNALLYKSEDHGQNWTWKAIRPPMMTALVLDRSVPDTLLLGSWVGGVEKSTDGGETWAKDSSGLAFVFDVIQGPGSSSLVYCAADLFGEIFKSTDGGTDWQRAATDPSAVSSLVVVRQRPMTLFANAKKGVFRSDDGAVTFQDFAPEGFSVLGIDPLLDETIYMRRGSRLLETEDGGRTLRDVTDGILASPIESLYVDPRDQFVLYAGGIGEVYATSNGGRTWTRTTEGLPSQGAVFGLLADPFDSSVLYAIVEASGVFKSFDRGAHWSGVSTGQDEKSFAALAADSGFRGVLYAASNAGVYRSNDAAVNWTKLSLPVQAKAIAVSPNGGGVVHVGSSTGLFKSTDSGATWQRSGDFTNVSEVVADPRNGNRLFAATGAGVFRSLDNGETWSNTGLAGAHHLAIDPEHPGRVYATKDISPSQTLGGSPLQSLDGGATWQSIGGGLSPNPSITSLAVGEDGVVYAGTVGTSVFSFEPIPDRPPIVREPSRPAPRPVGRRILASNLR